MEEENKMENIDEKCKESGESVNAATPTVIPAAKNLKYFNENNIVTNENFHSATPSGKNLKILFEDNHIIVVVKPQNIPSQGDSSGDDDMLTIIKAYLKEKYDKPGNVYLGLVHRLDRPTGGVMVFAKTSKAAERLCESIRDGEFYKKYMVVAIGCPRDKQARLSDWLVKDETNNIVKVSIGKIDGAKLAELDYKVLEVNGKLSLIDVNLLTGRSHQIRVQLSNLGNPVFGDGKYGGVGKSANLALWAYQLTFEHPVNKQTMVFKVFPPFTETPWKYFNIEKHINVIRPD